jgi:multidrug resistance efflux pump
LPLKISFLIFPDQKFDNRYHPIFCFLDELYFRLKNRTAMLQNNLRYSLENLIIKNRVSGFSMYVLILFMLIGTLISLPFIQVEVSAQARGILRPGNDPAPILSLVSGSISQVNMRNNQAVHRGDTLLRMDDRRTEEELAHQIFLRKVNQAVLHDLHEILGQSEQPMLTQATIRQEFDSFLAQKKEAQMHIQMAKIMWLRQQKLFADRVIPPVEYEQAEHDYQMALASWRITEAKQYAHWQRQFKESSDLQQSYDLAIHKLRQEKMQYVIRAPIDGTLMNVKGFEANSFLPSAGILAEISPNEGILAECQVGPKDIGLLRLGQMLRLQFDAFPFHQWGFIHGQVIEIERNPQLQHGAVLFRVRCRLLKKNLRLKNGQHVSVKHGMTFNKFWFPSTNT